MGCFNSTTTATPQPKPTPQREGPKQKKGGADEGGIIIASSNAFKKTLDPKDFMFVGRTGEQLVKKPGSVKGQQFVIMDCSDCDIFVCDHCEMVTIDRCKDCRIFIGPCESSIFVRNCERIKLVAACRQFRTRECEALDVLMHCVSQPSIETSRDVRFGCYQFFYFSLAQQFASAKLSGFNNRWSEVYNFNPQHGGFTLLEGAEAEPSAFVNLELLADFVPAEEARMWREQSPVPLTLGPSAAAAKLESCVLVCSHLLDVDGVFALIRSLQGLRLVRTLEFRVDAQWSHKLHSALEHCAEKAAFARTGDGDSVVVLHLAGEGASLTSAALIRAESASRGFPVASCSRDARAADAMGAIIFANEDSGHAMH